MFGKYSYCIYLVHFPLLFFEHRLISVFPDVPSWVQWMLWFMAISGESLLIGWISFVTFERRFLEKKSQINLRSEAAAN
jgi:peptidoglycan/LPS O-acetylase OafA/YrhL